MKLVNRIQRRARSCVTIGEGVDESGVIKSAVLLSTLLVSSWAGARPLTVGWGNALDHWMAQPGLSHSRLGLSFGFGVRRPFL